jgi:hypothetical protein
MKRITSNALGPLLLLLLAAAVQGCGGGGGDAAPGAETAQSTTPSRSVDLAGATPGDLLALFPTAAPPGGAVAAMGAGFFDHCAVELFLDALDQPLGTAAVQSDATYSAQFIIPEDTEEGEHTVIAQGRTLAAQDCSEPSEMMAEATFSVTAPMPVITLEELEGRPGAAVQVRGRGFCADVACSPVTILLDGQVGASGVLVDADGTFVADALVPAISAAGSVAVVAIQTDADGIELRAFGEITVTVRPNRSPTVIN